MAAQRVLDEARGGATPVNSVCPYFSPLIGMVLMVATPSAALGERLLSHTHPMAWSPRSLLVPALARSSPGLTTRYTRSSRFVGVKENL